MNKFITGIANNHIFITAFFAWLIAQALKIVTWYIKTRKIDFTRLMSAGGMPSSHAAATVSLATAVGYKTGWDSAEFAMALVFALVVMYDAAGVRRAAGKQAKILNKMIEEMHQKIKHKEERLKELLGHTPFEVVTGAVLGYLVAFLFTKL